MVIKIFNSWAQGMTQDIRLIGFPYDNAPATIFYRRDRLEELGYTINDLKTMDDWIEKAIEEIIEEDGGE
jgi:ABC-type glycerol-3-phosphate transport system substrate-binding protein